MRIRRVVAGALVAGACVIPAVGAPAAMADGGPVAGGPTGSGSSSQSLACLIHNLTTGSAPSPTICGTW
ncbi:hypothetical protein DFR70_1118 [Nocardia tenerifensis]|uniref:Uncharacterized protein n=1 Tax=Nocardia tenerifensis TaxID=228006 RepID=A0A318JSY1_9NOCA|nr:hypothetical protein [Nocardia tenerifensis]PXX59626.1 hypothetical protein DFR70_1118 [Nocardia tenerifensis]